MGLRKKQIGIMLVIIFVLMCSYIARAENNGVLSYGRIGVNMPEISAELKGSGYDTSDVTASLDSEVLKVDQIHTYDRAADTACVYILLDLSKSMKSSFELSKSNIVKYISSMGVNDKVVVITFGETEVTTVAVADGTETREEAIDKVNSLQCTENGTMFYEALSRAYQMANASVSEFDREYVIAFSDGIDEQKGNATYAEIANNYKTHLLPLYVACSANTSKEAADLLGELARSSGGSFQITSNESEFDVLASEINDVTILEMSAANNTVDGQEHQLSVKIGNLQVEQKVPVARSISDDVPPTVSDISFDAKNSSIIITFSETVKGSLDSEAYRITDQAGNTAEIISVSPMDAENTVEIKLNELHNSEYKITFHGITDTAKEQNPLSETKNLKVKGIKEPEEAKEHKQIPMWIVLVIAAGSFVLVVVVLILVIRLNKKKTAQKEENKQEKGVAASAIQTIPVSPMPSVIQEVDIMEQNANIQKQVKHHVVATESVMIHLLIKTGKQAQQKINMEVVSSVIVGRSDICDIYVDDTKMSRQHFVIEYNAGSLYIMDLQSRNGTMLNGTKIVSRQKLQSGDKIAAGLSDIVIQF